jgi:hypothetical protein
MASGIFMLQLPVIDIADCQFLWFNPTARTDLSVSQSKAMTTQDDMSLMICWIRIIEQEVFLISDAFLLLVIQERWIFHLAVCPQPKLSLPIAIPKAVFSNEFATMLGTRSHYPQRRNKRYTWLGGAHAVTC